MNVVEKNTKNVPVARLPDARPIATKGLTSNFTGKSDDPDDSDRQNRGHDGNRPVISLHFSSVNRSRRNCRTLSRYQSGASVRGTRRHGSRARAYSTLLHLAFHYNRGKKSSPRMARDSTARRRPFQMASWFQRHLLANIIQSHFVPRVENYLPSARKIRPKFSE